MFSSFVSKTNAISIESCAEYLELVKTILSKKLSALSIIVDMKEVAKCPKRVCLHRFRIYVLSLHFYTEHGE